MFVVTHKKCMYLKEVEPELRALLLSTFPFLVSFQKDKFWKQMWAVWRKMLLTRLQYSLR